MKINSKKMDTNPMRNTTIVLPARAFAGLMAAACLQSATATERLFTYTYEPETMPQGAMEFEQWVTLQAGRTKNVGQENYNRWDIREDQLLPAFHRLRYLKPSRRDARMASPEAPCR